MQAAMQYAFAMFATTSKANYKELTVLSTAHRLSLPPALRMLVDKYRCVALSDRPGSHIALDCMNEKINMAIADATRGKLRLENCDSLVKQAAAHQNVLLPAMERIGQALNFGQAHEITEGSRARAAEIDTIVAALEDKLGETWDEFRTSTGAFGGFDADAQVRRNDSWRGTERTRTFVLQKCEFHGL